MKIFSIFPFLFLMRPSGGMVGWAGQKWWNVWMYMYQCVHDWEEELVQAGSLTRGPNVRLWVL